MKPVELDTKKFTISTPITSELADDGGLFASVHRAIAENMVEEHERQLHLMELRIKRDKGTATEEELAELEAYALEREQRRIEAAKFLEEQEAERRKQAEEIIALGDVEFVMHLLERADEDY